MLFSSDSSLDIKIYASKQKKLNQRTAFLITHFPLFTTMFISQLEKEAEFKMHNLANSLRKDSLGPPFFLEDFAHGEHHNL